MAALLIRLIGWTLTIRLDDAENTLQKTDRPSVIYAFWHNRILLMPFIFEKYVNQRRLSVMISRSRDGQVISNIAASFGIEASRGSSSKAGSTAFRNLLSILNQPLTDGGVTPDGPRGPKYKVQRGVIELARHSGCPIAPITCHYKSKWELKSWDNFQIPKPFTTCTIVLSPGFTVKECDDPDASCRRLEKLLADPEESVSDT